LYNYMKMFLRVIITKLYSTVFDECFYFS